MPSSVLDAARGALTGGTTDTTTRAPISGGSSWESGFTTVTSGLSSLLSSGADFWSTIKGYPPTTPVPTYEPEPQKKNNNMLIMLVIAIGLIAALYFLKRK